MESVGIFLILSILFIGFTTIKSSKARVMYADKGRIATEEYEEKKKHNEKEGILFTKKVSYVGGLRSVLNKQECEIKMFGDNLKIFLSSKIETIDYKDIIDIEGKSETEISKDVTLTRLLLVGIYAFGLKKKIETTRKFFILTYNKLGKEYKVIFESTEAEDVINKYDEIREVALTKG